MDKTGNKATAKVSDEEWKNSSIYTELMVSSKGRVCERAYDKVVKDRDGLYRIYHVASKIIKGEINQVSGDLSVSFYSNGVWKMENVDYLVAKEFVRNDNPQQFSKVKHKDRNMTNVNPENLYWA